MIYVRIILVVCLVSIFGPVPGLDWSAFAAEETPGTTPIALVEEAYLAHRRGNYDEAVKLYTKIIQRRGLTKRERAISYLLRGEAKRDDGNINEAILDFNRALRQWPNYPHAYFFRGRIYELQGRLLEAYADIVQAVELDPQRESYQSHLAVLKKRLSANDLKKITKGELPQAVVPEFPEDEAP